MSGSELLAARARLLVQIDIASEVIAPLWPLSTSIAVNPLWDLRNMSFNEAIDHASQVLGINGYPSAEMFKTSYLNQRIRDIDIRASINSYTTNSNHRRSLEREDSDNGKTKLLTEAERKDLLLGTNIAATTDREVAKWCAAYVAGIMPTQPHERFYSAWLDIIATDPAVRSLLGKNGRNRLAQSPVHPEDSILESLELLGIHEDGRICELSRQLARMPGWAGHAKWRSRWASHDLPGPALQLVDYLAVRLSYDAHLVDSAPAGRSQLRLKKANVDQDYSGTEDHQQIQSSPENYYVTEMPEEIRNQLSGLSSADRARIWLGAYESNYRDQILSKLAVAKPNHQPSPMVQAVFCIDPRSEVIRRHLEALGPYETFGFAGFFGLPIHYQNWGSTEGADLCPVLVRPNAIMVEIPNTANDESALKQLQGRQGLAAISDMFTFARKGVLSSFILAEASGFVAGLIAIVKTLFPSRYERVRASVNRMLVPSVTTSIDTNPENGGMSDEAQALYAETALTTMGLTKNFASVVLLCGHGSSTENNPYASALDCGACGGNRGGASARAAATILNRVVTRNLLADRDIVIPKSTIFVAAEHDTATDTVTLFDSHLIPPARLDIIANLKKDLNLLRTTMAAERIPKLPGSKSRSPVAEGIFRSADWAQVQPEWGLARNAAMIIGSRRITAGINLEGRCFLHSYDSSIDTDGVALETILTAPMVVAHWINAQYYFSTVDSNVYCAGDKTIHNIVGGIGVVQGVGGDLRLGLPKQSLFDANQPYHEPMRLLTIVEAPQNLLDTVIKRNPVLRQLFDGEWVNLAARDNANENWKLRKPDGSWIPWIRNDRNDRTEGDANE